MKLAILGAAFALLTQGGPGAGAISRELSDSLSKKLQTLERYEHDPKARRTPMSISESELNSYVRYALSEKVPRGLRDLRIVIRDSQLELRGIANLAEFSEIRDKAGAAGLLAFLSGELPVEVVAAFRSDRGFGQFELQSAQIGPVPLSPTVVADLVARVTTDASRPQGFDVKAPFRLPYTLKRIRPQTALATLEF